MTYVHSFPFRTSLQVSGNHIALVCVHIVKHLLPTIKTRAHKYMYGKSKTTFKKSTVLLKIITC